MSCRISANGDLSGKDLCKTMLYISHGDITLAMLEHNHAFYEEFMSIFIQKLKHGPNREKWVEDLTNVLNSSNSKCTKPCVKTKICNLCGHEVIE